jgi:hypothetical protein
VLPDQDVELVPTMRPSGEPPPPNPPVVRPDPGGISPGFFFAGAGLTALAGTGLILSALDTRRIHGQFELYGCESSPAPPCAGLADDGQAAQTRTNVLVGVTAALGVATVALGFLVRWRTPKVGFLSLRYAF